MPLNLAQNSQSAAIRQHQIEKNAVVFVNSYFIESIIVGKCLFAEVILPCKVIGYTFRQFPFIFYDKQFHVTKLCNVDKYTLQFCRYSELVRPVSVQEATVPRVWLFWKIGKRCYSNAHRRSLGADTIRLYFLIPGPGRKECIVAA